MNAAIPLNDAQIRRLAFRSELFQRRGMAVQDAEQWGARLTTRDFERDDRRICFECSSLQRGGTCFAVKQGVMANVSPKHSPVPDILQRCDHFTWQKP